jgi:hypothetical protein
VDVGIDLERKAPVPHDDHIAIVGDRLDDATVSDNELTRVVGDAQHLDAGAHANARTDAGCEKAGTVRIHVGCIGRKGRKLDGPGGRRQERPNRCRNASGRRARPNSTA